MKKYSLIIIILVPILYFSCAKIGSPTGGNKDTISPIVLKSSPEYKDTGFANSELVFRISEFFEIKDINTNFFSSPPFLTIPDFKIIRKKLIVKLNEDLKDTTTYTFYFGNAIQDYTESNPITDFAFVFSTGSVVDSFSVSGYVYDAKSLEKAKDVYVMLYKKITDSIPYLETPYFLAKTDTSGYFYIRNIKQGNYKIFGLTDMNTNLLYDMPNESIGFLDSNITTSVKIIERIDSLQNLKYIYDSTNVNIIDSILVDSIVNNVFYEYSPDNLKIFMFDEDNNKQFVKEAVRPKKGKTVITFKNELNEIPEIITLNFTNENFLIETFTPNDSIIYWLTDTSLLNIDTIKMELSYLQIDSVNNYFYEKDTVSLVYKDEDADSLYLKLETNLTENFDFYENIEFETGTPIFKIDTSKIHLYQLIDSTVLIDKTQAILKNERHQKDLLIFTFKQPLINTPKIDFLNFEEDETDFSISQNSLNDSLVVEIFNENIYNKEKLDFIIYYDNDYYLNQYQTFADKISLNISEMKILEKKREKQDEIELVFNKDLSTNINLKLLNNNILSDWYKIENIGNLAKISILDSTIFSKDTLIFSINTLDYENIEYIDVEFNDTISVILNHVQQTILNSYRDLTNHFVLEFSKPLIEEPVLNLLNSELKYWCRTTFEANSKKVEYEIYHAGTRNSKEIEFSIDFKDVDKKGKKIQKHDTLKLQVTKQVVSTIDSVGLVIELEKDFKILKDSAHFRKFNVEFDKIQGEYYKLVVDSLAFTDIYNMYNDSTSNTFELREEDYYGKLVLNISKLGEIQYNKIEINKLKADTLLSKDSISISEKILEGQAIVQILNSKDETLYEYFITDSQEIIIPNLSPQSFTLKIIYDKNNNKKWDTGNYLKNQLPEKIFYYSNSAVIKSGFDTEVDWILETY